MTLLLVCMFFTAVIRFRIQAQVVKFDIADPYIIVPSGINRLFLCPLDVLVCPLDVLMSSLDVLICPLNLYINSARRQ